MRITYVTHTRFPTEKAHGLQVAQVCHALAEIGHDMTLVAPTIGNAITKSAHEYYGLAESFKVLHLKQFDALRSRYVPGFLSFAVMMFSYRRVLKAFFKTYHADLLYCRSAKLLPALLQTDIPVIIELHALPRRSSQFVTDCNRCKKVVCLTRAMRDEVVSWGVDAGRAIVEGDGVQFDRFARSFDPSVEKKRWELPENKIIIGYAGSLIALNKIEKGISELLEALSILKKNHSNIFGWIVGGSSSQIERYRKRAQSLGLTSDDVCFQGRVSARDVPSCLAAMDVCIYPAPASDHPYFMRDTSPLKLFEYLAAGRSVVCSDIPPVRDVVDESIVEFCKAGSPESIADGITNIISNPNEASARTEKGKEKAKWYDWTSRMRRIIPEAGQ